MSQKRPFMIMAAALLCTGLTTAVPGAAVQAAVAAERAPAGPVRGAATDGFFHIEWAASPRATGGETIAGYLYNDGGDFAQTVELRVTALDRSGQPVASVVDQVTKVPPGNHVYFQVPAPARSQSYRVAVESYDLVQGSID